MTRAFAHPAAGWSRLRAALGVAVVVVLSGAALGCAGNLDPSLLTGGAGSGGPGTGGTNGGGGTGASPSVCDANTMFFPACTAVGCHTAGTTSTGGGLDLTANGLVARLLNKGPSTNVIAGASCTTAGKPYLVPSSSPATGLLLDKMSQSTTTCGTVMPQIGSVTNTQMDCLKQWATAVTTGVITQ